MSKPTLFFSHSSKDKDMILAIKNTIGIILCSQKNEAIVKYSVLNDAQQVFASRYRLTLPSAEELQHEIEAERKRIEEQEE